MNESVTDNIDIENETKVVETLKRLFPNVFIPFDGLPPSRGKQFDMTIKLKTEEIPKSKLYPVPIAHLEELKKQINDRLNKGWIKRSRSPFGSPILFVSKPDGGWRLCVDYRELNKITVRDDYPLPRINELLNNTRLAYWLSKLDLLDGYHQIRINEGEQYKTAFKTTFGTFEYTVTPFGLAGAGANFQRLMDHIFQLEILNMKICVYLDDILIMTNSDSLDDHINDLIEIFKILQKHDFKVKLSKCKFARREIEFLGHVVGRGTCLIVESTIAKDRQCIIDLYNQRLFCPFWNNDGRTSDDRLFFSLFVFEVIVIVIVNVTVIVIVTVDYLKLNNYCLILLSNLAFLIAYGRNPSTVADLAIPLNREPSDTVNDNEIESLLNYTSTIIINVRNNLIKIRNKMLSNYNKNKKYNDFKIGDKVYVKEKRPSKKWNKLEAVYAGPYEIIDIDKQNLNITIRDYISGVSRIRTTSKTLHVKYFKHAPKDDVNEREYIPVEKLDSFLNNDELISDVKMSDISNEDEITDETMDQDDVVNHQDEINQDEDDISDLEDLNDLMTDISSIDSSLEPKGHFSDLQLSRILNPEKNTYHKVREILNNNKSSPNTFINLLRTLEEKESVIDYPHNKVTEESNLLINSIMKFAISPELFEMIQKRSFKIVSKRRLTSNTDYLVKISNTVGWVSRQILAKHASKQINDFNKKIDNLNPV
ncbi:reverse transcriptase, partial [Heterostelium album PN500]